MTKNHARTFYEIYSSKEFAHPGKQNDTPFNRLANYLQTNDENTISEFIVQCRLVLNEILFDLKQSSLSEEAKSQYNGIVQKVRAHLSKSQPWVSLNDGDLPEIARGFLFLSEQRDVFSFRVEEADNGLFLEQIEQMMESLQSSDLNPEHKIKIETALHEISTFLFRSDTASYELAWKHLSQLMTLLFRIDSQETNPKKKATLKVVAAWVGGTMAALHLLAQFGDDVQKLEEHRKSAVELIENALAPIAKDQEAS
ncbi:MAG TPA: hypothetical protein PLR76_04325 [Hyphomonas sp.]|nr:hypothetical protein [Hyphomonas sp.]